ncbi:hypothetical protein SCLCIDRAFT_765145 [Scleroderma citrinum Foug A]|uniref:Uncharacterized protein n=1 Tax=Scleroderma citrinum Foug A TaxID=1036808 RepID=A0A0C2YLY0_9AGAM|nr:hypothetical protein SCLCIDRAFT_765145 [Scleroderma citrinum Foug A]
MDSSLAPIYSGGDVEKSAVRLRDVLRSRTPDVPTGAQRPKDDLGSDAAICSGSTWHQPVVFFVSLRSRLNSICIRADRGHRWAGLKMISRRLGSCHLSHKQTLCDPEIIKPDACFLLVFTKFV